MAKIDPKEPCPCGSGKIFEHCHGPRVKPKVAPQITDRVSLRVIPEPDPNTRTVFQLTGSATLLIQGFETGLSLDCGGCGTPLVTGIHREQIQNIVIRCKNCKAFNEA
jgi:hypothetical protein